MTFDLEQRTRAVRDSGDQAAVNKLLRAIRSTLRWAGEEENLAREAGNEQLADAFRKDIPSICHQLRRILTSEPSRAPQR